jgi:hypothetical protein
LVCRVALKIRLPFPPHVKAMSAILSADDLNDFISPGVACIKPVETLPLQGPEIDIVSPTHSITGSVDI